jgi:hypothetical protein
MRYSVVQCQVASSGGMTPATVGHTGRSATDYNNTFTKKILLSIRWTSKLLASGTENYNKHLHQQENESTLAPLCNVEQQASLHKMFQN